MEANTVKRNRGEGLDGFGPRRKTRSDDLYHDDETMNWVASMDKIMRFYVSLDL